MRTANALPIEKSTAWLELISKMSFGEEGNLNQNPIFEMTFSAVLFYSD